MRLCSSNKPSLGWPAVALALGACLAGTAYGQYLPGNVCQPGDPIIASSANSPASEGVKNAIDGTTAKYLNFDMKGDAIPSGFVVTPSVGATWVFGVSMETANDSPDRDPKEITLEGSNDDPSTISWTTGNWTMIADIANIPAITNRYTFQTFYFTNYTAFRSYRWTVLHTQGINGVPSTCCMQTAEVQLLGTALPKNVAQPSDQIFASSANSPASEGVANAIDGTTAKYLNFDMKGDAIPAGFAFTPQVGATLINGISMETANDSPDRDPKEITVEGSNDATITGFAGGNWTQIAHISNIPAITNRYTFQTFLFPNSTPYLHYRWTVLHTQGINGVPSTCCMQTAEVQFLGSSSPQNVVIPSDQIFASSANSPASEGVANAIDGTTAKYLNFDMKGDAIPAGFAVTPSVGPTVIVGLGMETANDSPDRDPKEVTIEGSNDDTITGFGSGNWTLIADIANIPAVTNRYYWQYFYFPNELPYKHYRWTVLHTEGINGVPSTCCMQIAEVQLLAVTAKADCSKAAFVSTPVDSPALAGSPAEFFVEVNGPWPLQWATNGVPVAGATKTSFTTDPISAANTNIAYTVAIVGCQTSAPVHAVIFTPSPIKSVGIKFNGGGANGTQPPSQYWMDTNDIAGVQLQAFWNTATNDLNGTAQLTGSVGDGTSLPDALLDSDGKASTVTFDYSTSGRWGVGVDISTPTGRILNGVAGANGPGTDQIMTFHNVPAGSTNAVLVYAMSPPLQFQEVSYNIGSQTYYARLMNKDEYDPAPGFYRATSTDSNAPTVANFIRFDGVKPDASGDITLTYDVLTSAAQATGLGSIQLVVNAPNPGSPPVVTQDPQPTVAPAGGTATLTVVATGNNLTYQWRKDGATLANAGHVSGANTATLTISSFSAADAGNYSVAVFNPAGSIVSKNARVDLSNYNIQDRLVDYFKFNETTGTTAANSATNGVPAVVSGTVSWGAGKVGGAFTFDGSSSYMFVSNYTKPTTEMAISAWVNIPSSAASAMTIIRNADGNLSNTDGQFDFGLTPDASGNPLPTLSIVIGADVKRITSPTPISFGAWHNIAFSADGAQLRLYIDGQQVASLDYLGPINATQVPWLSIGARLAADNTVTPPTIAPDTTPNYLMGALDELALWTRSLSASEVTALFNAGSAGKELTTIVETASAVPPILTVTHAAGTITLSWDHGTLSTAATANGPFTDTTFTSPHTEPTTGSAKFFRAHN